MGWMDGWGGWMDGGGWLDYVKLRLAKASQLSWSWSWCLAGLAWQQTNINSYLNVTITKQAQHSLG